MPPVSEPRFAGMLSNARADVPVSMVSYAENYFLDDGVWVPRPGTVSLGRPGGANRIQGIVNFVELDGTQHLLVFSNADMHEYNWGTGLWTTTDLNAAGVTVDPSEDLEFVNSRGRLVVTDGVNTPWMVNWTGAAWNFTVLANAPVADGVELYYAKAFFYDIPAEENEFEWSDEADPANGYEANDQVWEFAQRDSGRIVAMRALNELMVILKEDSASMLMGAVDDQFRTNAVREGLSETEGCVGRRAAVVYEGDVYVLSQEGPRIAVGGQRWQNLEVMNGVDVLEDIWSGINRSEWQNAIGFVDSQRAHVGWLIPRGSGTDLNYAIVYAVRDGAFQIFQFPAAWDITAVAEVEDDEGNEYLLIGTEDGYVYQYGGSATDDAGTAIPTTLRSRPYGRSMPSVEKRLVEVHLRLYQTGDLVGELRPVVDGVVGSGKRFGLALGNADPRRRLFRAGMNVVGREPGWELYVASGTPVSVEAATTFLTNVGAYGNV